MGIPPDLLDKKLQTLVAQTTQVELRTERLLLRAARDDDLHAYHEWYSDPETMSYWSCAPHNSIERTKESLEQMIDSPFNGVVNFTVCLLPAGGNSETRDTNSKSKTPARGKEIVIGKAGIYDTEQIGYIFNRKYWGKGYAFEALDPILKRYWSLYPENKVIEADVDPRNEGSLRLLKKLGFKVTGSAERTYETHLGWCDSVYLEAKRPA